MNESKSSQSREPLTPSRALPKPLRKLEKSSPEKTGRRESLWKGPKVDGITFSLMSKFVVCRDRFHKKVVLGLREPNRFDKKMHYGSIWHEGEELYARGKAWLPGVQKYGLKLRSEYPSSEKEIVYWTEICKKQFAVYVNHYAKDRVRMFTPALQEVPFKVVLTKTGDILRGKIDSAFISGETLWVQENKTKGEIDAEAIFATVPQNMQAMIYHVVLQLILSSKDLTEQYIEAGANKNAMLKLFDLKRKGKLKLGTIYNVVRRPLSDRYAIKQGKKETEQAFLNRLQLSIKEKASHFFHRQYIPITEQQLKEFENQILYPHLYQVNKWWNSIEADPFNPWKSPEHSKFPFGVFHGLAGGYRGDFYNLYIKGQDKTLETVDDLFPELKH